MLHLSNRLIDITAKSIDPFNQHSTLCAEECKISLLKLNNRLNL